MQPSLPPPVHLNCWQGSTFERKVYFTDENGDPLDLSGRSFRLQVRVDYDDAETIFDLSSPSSGLTVDAVNGILTITITAAQTAAVDVPADAPGRPPSARWVYDLEMVNGSIVTKPLYGAFIFIREVTR